MDILEQLRPHLSEPLWFVVIVAIAWFSLRRFLRSEDRRRDDDLHRRIHDGLTLWINNGGGQQIRRIVREEVGEAIKKHEDIEDERMAATLDRFRQELRGKEH